MKLHLFALLPALPASPAVARHEGHGAPAGADASRAEDDEGEEALTAEQPPEALTVALGPYPMTREASGTAWQPEASPHGGAHVTAGRWSLMGNAMLYGVYDWQGAPRGGEKGFVAGMAMGSARRPVGVQLRARGPRPLLCGRPERGDGLPSSHGRPGWG